LSIGNPETGVKFGYPTTDETKAPDHVSSFNHFELQITVLSLRGLVTTATLESAIDLTEQFGAHTVQGTIAVEFAHLGWEQSPLGYPTTDQAVTGKGDGQFNFFQNGAILYSQATGAHDVYGAIRDEYAKLGWEQSVLGYPTTDEAVTGKGDGLFSFFQNDGAILYSQATGAH
jgi:uncharacterized protein with LGFP repeats